MKRCLLVVLAVSTLASLSLPAHAGPPASFADPKGDANGLNTQTAAGSEPSLDIVGGTVYSDGTNLIFTMKLDALAPVLPNGVGYDFDLNYGDVGYGWTVYRDAVPFDQNETFFHTTADDDTSLDLPECGGCKGKVDVKAKTVSLVAPLTAMARAVKKADPGAKPFGPGSTVTDFRLQSNRYLFGSSIKTDTATGGDTLSFTV